MNIFKLLMNIGLHAFHDMNKLIGVYQKFFYNVVNFHDIFSRLFCKVGNLFCNNRKSLSCFSSSCRFN